MRHRARRFSGERLFLALRRADAASDRLRRRPLPDVRAGEPRLRRALRKRLGTVGDAGSAKLLEKIYRDEIGHVAYGLKWFRRWKNPGESDWDAFCRTLKFPLSPQRAKGFSLNVAGRQAAGLDEDFISQLNVYSQSKGRTPSVFVFNAFTEGRLAEGKNFNPTKPQAQLARDLENLPQFLCRQDDIVLVQQKPAVEFLSGIKQAGFPLPEFADVKNVAALQTRKLGSLRPWAWGPDSWELLNPVFASVTGEKRAENTDSTKISPSCIPNLERGFSAKDFAAASQSLLAAQLCSENEIGVAVNSFAEAQAEISRIRARGHHKIVVEAIFWRGGQQRAAIV